MPLDELALARREVAFHCSPLPRHFDVARALAQATLCAKLEQCAASLTWRAVADAGGQVDDAALERDVLDDVRAFRFAPTDARARARCV